LKIPCFFAHLLHAFRYAVKYRSVIITVSFGG
jgi:hypothetical protein